MPSVARYAAIVAVGLMASSAAMAQIYRPGLEYRSLNTAEYEIAIQKNGRVDVATMQGEAIFLNAYPMVWYADEDEPEVARLDGRNSGRFEVNDRLGRGQGMRIRKKEVEWKLRAYPTKPYMAVQLVYINDTKKPVQIKALLPWCLGDPKKGSLVLGPGTPNSIVLSDSLSASEPVLSRNAGVSKNVLAVFNPAANRTMIAGFVTQNLGTGSIELNTLKPDPKEPNQFDYMRTMSLYDPPITVQPGEVLESELLYIAVTEPEPLLALERYAKGVAVVNEIPNYVNAPLQAVHISQEGRAFAEYRGAVLEAAEVIASGPLPTTSVELVLDATWTAEGLANRDGWDSVIQQLRAKGFAVGLYFDPFAPDSVQNPEWLITGDGGVRAIDLTNDGARQWLLAELSSSQQQLQFDSIWGLNPGAYMSLPLGDGTSIRTRAEMAGHAIDLLRTAIPRSTRLNLVETDLMPLEPNTNVISTRLRAQAFYLTPHLGFRYFIPQTPEEYVHPALAFASGFQQVYLYEHWPRVAQMLEESPLHVPTLARPSKPQGAFYTETPDVWLTRQSEGTGAWMLATALNRDSVSRPTTVPIPSLSPRSTTQYALFDLDQLHYYGRAANQVNINVEGNSARTLLLREYRGHPTVLGTTRPIAESTPDRIPQAWSPETLKFTAAIEGAVNESAVYVLVPDELKPVSAEIEGTAAEWSEESGVVRVTLPGSGKKRVDWSVQFAPR